MKNMKNLIDILKSKGAKLAGTLGLASALSGCATPDIYQPGGTFYEQGQEREREARNNQSGYDGSNDGILLSIGGLGLSSAGIKNNNLQQINAGNKISDLGNALSGKTEVNVYNGNKGNKSEGIMIKSSNEREAQSNEDELIGRGGSLRWVNDYGPLGKRNFYICEGVKDHDSNGRIDYPDDFININDSFSSNKNIYFIASHEKENRGLTFKLYDNEGKLIESHTQDKDSRAYHRIAAPNELKEGKYTVKWTYSGDVLAIMPFEVHK